MIVYLICSFAGEIRPLLCSTSFPVDWLSNKLSIMFGISKDTLKYTLEDRPVNGGLVGDYIRNQQQKAYVTICLDSTAIQKIHCFVKYKSFIRRVSASPQASLFDIVMEGLSNSLTSVSSDVSPTLQLEVDGVITDPLTLAKGCLHYGSVIQIISFTSTPIEESSPEQTSSNCNINFIIAENVTRVYSFSPEVNITYKDLVDHACSLLDISPPFIILTKENGEVLSSDSLPGFFTESDNLSICVRVDLKVRDPLGKIHSYSPLFNDTVANIVTDIQNCPFIRLPMKLTKNEIDCEPETPVWNLLKDADDTTVFRATERIEDIECLLLTEDYKVTIDTQVYGMKSISIPEDALLCVESCDDYSIYVEYNGDHHVEIPVNLCNGVPEVDDFDYENPVVKKACIEWNSNCPYQLPTQQNHKYVITKESNEFYYGHDIDNEEKQGWIMKSLLV